ncbi:hypothetical protein KP509_31G069600 [Ceratopteris richardii]|nr:hypothetical protein KP509_31G069600 [Ceratopteris richardii]
MVDTSRAGEILDTLGISSDVTVLQGSPFTMNLTRPHVKDVNLEEVLSMNLNLLSARSSAFRVFVNLPGANEQTTVTLPEFCGLFYHLPAISKNPDTDFQATLVQLGISDIIKDLGLSDHSRIPITIVPFGVDKQHPIILVKVEILVE